MSAYRMSYELSKYFANKDAALNETAKYPIKAPPADTKSTHQFYVRSELEATTGTTVSGALNHGPGIKVYHGSFPAYEIHINGHDPIDVTQIQKDSALNSKQRKYLMSFLHDNQSALVAYWYTKDIPSTVFTDYFRYVSDTVNYNRNQIQQKTFDQLKDDRIVITEYIRNKLGDETIELNFGNDPVNKINKRR